MGSSLQRGLKDGRGVYMGKIVLKDADGNAIAQANYGSDVVIWDAVPQGDDVRLPDYENDGYILPLEISDARKQLEKVLNSKTVSSGGPLGLGGYGGTTKLFVEPSKLFVNAPGGIPSCYTNKVTVELEEPYTECTDTFLWFRTGCEQKTAKKEVDMWIQWKDGQIILSQYPTAPSCPVEAPPVAPPPPPPAPPAGEPIASYSMWESLKRFVGAPITTALALL